MLPSKPGQMMKLLSFILQNPLFYSSFKLDSVFPRFLTNTPVRVRDLYCMLLRRSRLKEGKAFGGTFGQRGWLQVVWEADVSLP